MKQKSMILVIFYKILSLLDILSFLHKSECCYDIMIPPSMSTSTVGLINTSCSITMVGSTQTFVGGISDNYLETVTECRSINDRLTGYFCSEVVFYHSNKVLSDTKNNVMGEELGFTPTILFINDSDLKRDIENFARKTRC